MKTFVILFIRLYQNTVSPVAKQLFGGGCRFSPTCSEYTIRAVEKYGLFTGLARGLKRFAKCNPLGDFGYDPA